MGDENICDDLKGDGLQGWVALGEAMEEEGEVFLGEVLGLRVSMRRISGVTGNIPCRADSTVRDK